MVVASNIGPLSNHQSFYDRITTDAEISANAKLNIVDVAPDILVHRCMVVDETS